VILGRLREERGMVLGLAIIVVVVVGVMGAGLLAFVSTDLQAVVAVNKGEQAFELAEAGVEVAKAHLANDPGPANWTSGELHLDAMNENSVSATIEHDNTDGSFGIHRPVRPDQAQDRSHLLPQRRTARTPGLARTLRVRASAVVVNTR
jgi:Tfp pilus assembly protein PilX